MRKVLDVLHIDIVNAWNMKDPQNVRCSSRLLARTSNSLVINVQHLKKPEFLALISVLVEDLSEEIAYAHF